MGEERGVVSEILSFCLREDRLVRRGRGLRRGLRALEVVLGVFVQLRVGLLVSSSGEGDRKENKKHTFAILARRYERMRNLKRSSSVWMTIKEKLEAGSIFPVISSTVSIY